MEKTKEEIRKIADNHMLDEIRFIDAENIEPKEVFKDRQPTDLMPDAKSLIISSVYVGGFYLPDEDLDVHAKMSRLTLSGFYFNVVDPLKPICEYLISKGFKAIIYDGLLEDNCVPLKPSAVKAGLGWIGKNTLLLNQKYGSFQALGAIITDADLSEVYKIEGDHCGSCTSCISNCPTKALEPRQLNRSICLSNLLEEDGMPETIESIPQNYFFECDLCQEACPWNKTHLSKPLKTRIGNTFTSQKELLNLFRFDVLLNMDEDTYNKKILPLLTGVNLSYDLFKRNVRLAYNNKHINEYKNG